MNKQQGDDIKLTIDNVNLITSIFVRAIFYDSCLLIRKANKNPRLQKEAVDHPATAFKGKLHMKRAKG